MVESIRWQKLILLFSIGCYIISMAGTVYTGDCNNEVVGLVAFIFGCFGLFEEGGIYLLWLANPAIWLSWLVFKNIKSSFVYSLIAFALACYFHSFKTIEGMCGGSGWDTVTPNYDEHILSFGEGYWLWLFSVFLMLLWNAGRLLGVIKNSSRNQSE